MAESYEVVKAISKLIIGLALIIGVIWFGITFGSWRAATINFVKGAIVIIVFLVGIVFLILGFTGFRE